MTLHEGHVNRCSDVPDVKIRSFVTVVSFLSALKQSLHTLYLRSIKCMGPCVLQIYPNLKLRYSNQPSVSKKAHLWVRDGPCGGQSH